MAINSILQTALSGLNANAAKASAAAHNVVNQGSDDARRVEARPVSVVTGGRADQGAGGAVQVRESDANIDLGREFATLIAADAAYRANAEVLRRADEQARELLDVIG